MNTPASFHLRAAMVAALVAFTYFVPSAIAADENIGQQVATIPVPAELKVADVKRVVVRALAARRWELRDSSEGKVVAHYARGKNDATLTIIYDAKQIDIYGVGTTRGGGFPMRWVENLKKDLNVFLAQESVKKD